jgi:hypothetical protein
MGREVSDVACEPFKLVTSEQMWYMISVCVSSDPSPHATLQTHPLRQRP